MTVVELDFRVLSLTEEPRALCIGQPLLWSVKHPFALQMEVLPLCLVSSPWLVWTNLLCKVNLRGIRVFLSACLQNHRVPKCLGSFESCLSFVSLKNSLSEQVEDWWGLMRTDCPYTYMQMWESNKDLDYSSICFTKDSSSQLKSQKTWVMDSSKWRWSQWGPLGSQTPCSREQ